METLIKICGIKSRNEAEIVNRYPVDFIGFIFTPVSKRHITIKDAEEIRKLVRDDIRVVGVFLNQDTAFIQEAVCRCNLQGVQLHGDFKKDLEKARELKTWQENSFTPLEIIIKSIAVKDETILEEIEKALPLVDYILCDTCHKGASGGTGKVFNWNIIAGLNIKEQLILAGGLNPDNVADAVKTVNPAVLDINSGVETEMVKDDYKIKQVFENLKKIKKGN
jgi:phosphoribosylanthranilate isomerase